MRRAWCLLLWLAVASAANAQPLTRQNLPAILGFENNTQNGVYPARWGGGPTDGILTDDQVAHSGKYSARIERTASSSSTFSNLSVTLPLDFAGRTIVWRGFLKWENVPTNSFVALWMRVDGPTSSGLAFATLQTLNLNGTRDWTPYSISVPVPAGGTQVIFGFLLTGTGKSWVDDLELLADGIPVGQAAPRVPTPLDTDHEFDQGSRVSVSNLSNPQIKNLATLARVWGFVKYHHPAVTGGLRHWDYDLFRILPKVLAASDTKEANAAMLAWINDLGAVQACSPCANLDSNDLALSPDVGWIGDASRLGADLSGVLDNIYRSRKVSATQFYASLAVPGAGNPVFNNELNYATVRFPDSGYQLLALFRFWNMVQYFYPNRDILADDPAQSAAYWDTALEAFIPSVALASNATAYQQELMKFIAGIHDTHANLWSSIGVRPPIGPCQLPVDIRFVEGRPIVLRYISVTAGPASGLRAGDLIEQLDGIPVDDLVNQWRPIYADSNEAARLRDIALYLTRGPCGAANVVVQRGNDRLTLQSSRVAASSLDFSESYKHDRAGDTFQTLSDDIAYLKLSSVKVADAANYIRSASAAKGMIIDIRNYPSEFVVFALGQLLVSQPSSFARFTKLRDTTNPGAYYWAPNVTLVPQLPHYSGKVVILIDEETQSQAEYTTMAFRTAPGAIVIGSTTAGADGDVSTIPLPGGLTALFSGNGVFYPDKRPTQRVGIIPDIEVLPTLEGIRAGRDEPLEEAIRQIRGQPTPSVSFFVKNQGAVSLISSGTSSNLAVGYGTIQPDGANTSSGLAILGFRQNNMIVSETSVPATSLIQNGRIYAEISATVNTGLAIANPGNQTATISFYFTDSSSDFGNRIITIPAKGQTASFLNEAPFNGRSSFIGTFTFTSSIPVAVTALRWLTNSRRESLITTLPVLDLNAPFSAGSLTFPHFADGGGWTTQIVLTNPTDSALTGTIQFRDSSGRPLAINIDNHIDSSFAYAVAPRNSQKLQTSGTGTPISVGSIRLVPAANAVSPVGIAIFSFQNGGTTVSEASVPAAPAGNSFRLFTQTSGEFKINAIASIQTGIAVTNASVNTATVTLELFKLDGSSTGLKGTLSIPPDGHTATFLSQLPEFASLQSPFQGTLRVSSSASISVVGFRGRYNERRDFLVTTLPPVNEASPAVTSSLFFPHIVDSGGYTTQFVIFSTQPSAGTLSLFSQSGPPLNVILR